MSYVGKILVVIQVVMSLLFMAFAGAVYSVHQNWKGKFDAAQQTLQSTQESLRVAQEELTTAKRDFETRLAEQTQRATEFQARNTTLTNQYAALQEQYNLVEQQRQTQTGLAEAKAAEARFRQEEAEKQRIENRKLQTALDGTAAEVRDLKDELFTRNEDFRQLQRRYDGMLSKTAFLERVVASNNLETDPEVVDRMKSPPPPVQGLVLNLRKNRANRVQFVEISIGSDDGLVRNHELDVVRIPSNVNGNGREAEWLGRVRVVDVFPDNAVCEVIQVAKNGIIEEGDNVTSKL